MPLRIFIADLHLRTDEPQGLALFADFLSRFGAHSELYVLGDLFDLWLGDDLDLPRYPRVMDALRAYADRGGVARLMVGNHDFLLGDAFFAQSRTRLLPDPTVLDHAGQRLLLTHGDALCTADVDYQAFRTRIRNPTFVAEFLALPADRRQGIARDFQNGSRTATAGKTTAMMDVDTQAANAMLIDAGASLLLHGHTHRPGVHRLPAGRQVVLGPWQYQESALIWPATGAPQPLNMNCATDDIAG